MAVYWRWVWIGCLGCTNFYVQAVSLFIFKVVRLLVGATYVLCAKYITIYVLRHHPLTHPL